MELFWRRGYAATSLGDLLAAMGIARKSLYDTFGSKRELFIRAVDLYARREIGVFESTLHAPGSPLANVRRALVRRQRADGGDGSRGCLLATNTAHVDPGDADLQALLDRHHRDLERAFRAALTRAQVAGELADEVDPGDLAALLVAALQGAALLCRTRPDARFASRVGRAMLSALTSSSAVPTEPDRRGLAEPGRRLGN